MKELEKLSGFLNTAGDYTASLLSQNESRLYLYYWCDYRHVGFSIITSSATDPGIRKY